MTTTEVDNWPADADGVMGPDLMARFEKHARRFDTEIIFDHIHTAKLKERPFTLVGDAGTYGKPIAWINAAGPAAPSGAADAHESLRKVLGYVGARIVEDAVARVPVSRGDVGEDGTITGEAAREAIRRAVEALSAAV